MTLSYLLLFFFLLSSSIRHVSDFLNYFAFNISLLVIIVLFALLLTISLKYNFVVVINVMTLVKHKSFFFFKAFLKLSKENARRISFITWQVILKLSFLIALKIPNDSKFPFFVDKLTCYQNGF